MKIVSLLSLVAMVGSFSQVALAGAYTCPDPSQVLCVPTASTLGAWTANGGAQTGNTFMNNNQCANAIQLNAQQWRLFCCYTKCGVFIQDVPAHKCEKIGQSHFRCQ